MATRNRNIAEMLSNTAVTNPDGAAIGGGEADIFTVNNQTLTVNHTIDSADNAMAAGPITVDSGVTLTVNGYWSVV